MKHTWTVASSFGSGTYTVAYSQTFGTDMNGCMAEHERWTCACPAGQHGKPCKHIAQIQAEYQVLCEMDVARDWEDAESAEHNEYNGTNTVEFRKRTPEEVAAYIVERDAAAARAKRAAQDKAASDAERERARQQRVVERAAQVPGIAAAIRGAQTASTGAGPQDRPAVEKV